MQTTTSIQKPGRVGTEEDIAKVIEVMADVEHDRWSKWHRYFISKCRVYLPTEPSDVVLLALPKELSERWTRQCDTKYANLSETEKDSDRNEVRNTLIALSKIQAKISLDSSEGMSGSGKVINKIQEETAKEIIADYMEALDTVVLPQEVWLWIADINGKYLNKTYKD